ncbi:hypothetical protein L3X38_005115 [Prunus dulcis]|uniref:Uncharacterized protein n=1 Tax=Prunus dulcis TaxID=3755 RepID=A0AAD4ZQB9_PRUDU|nr:hypothetical protein L3X38_005115 [Prunus dulcis]
MVVPTPPVPWPLELGGGASTFWKSVARFAQSLGLYRCNFEIFTPGSTSSKEDLKKKVLEILDLDDESMASASATQPEDEVDPFANEDMLDNYHPDLYGGPQ